jgi:transcriptional regulator of acetoin/glycerol metabolism
VVAAELAALFELPLPEARKRARAWFDRTYMARRLEDTAGNVSEAARQSGMARANFHRDLRKVGLNPVDFSSES